MFRMLENQREVCCWKRDDLRESEGGGYHVKGEGGVFLLVYRLVESIYLLCLAVSRLKGV